MRLQTASPENKTRIGIRVTRKNIMRLQTALSFFVNCSNKIKVMEKKEAYRHVLPHFQQPGQAYFVTWNLKDAIPPKALARYTQRLETLSTAILNCGENLRFESEFATPKIRESEFAAPDREKTAWVLSTTPQFVSPEIEKLKQEYFLARKKCIKAYDDLLDTARNPAIDLSRPENTAIVFQSLLFWESKKLASHVFSIMPNHVHWVFELFEKDREGSPVYLQDILQSVKRFSSNQINKLENREGTLWQKESFDTTIRDERHFYYAVRYTLQNPVKAGLVADWKNWKGNWMCSDIGCRDF